MGGKPRPVPLGRALCAWVTQREVESCGNCRHNPSCRVNSDFLSLGRSRTEAAALGSGGTCHTGP